jgi:hypothetical protein
MDGKINNGRRLKDLRLKQLKYIGINTWSVHIIYFYVYLCVYVFIYFCIYVFYLFIYSCIYVYYLFISAFMSFIYLFIYLFIYCGFVR